MKSAQKVMERIMTLVNLPTKFDRLNEIPESTYGAVKAEIEDFGNQRFNEGKRIGYNDGVHDGIRSI